MRSVIELPELEAAAGSQDTDITIEWGRLPGQMADSVEVEPLMRVAKGRFQFNAPAGRYQARGGKQIVIDPRPSASARDIRLYLLGTTLAALCHQRALLPLHGAAIGWIQQAFAVIGPSGAGKSTLAAQLQSQGRTVLADDLCVVDIAGDHAVWVRPGLARIKLWKQSPALVGRMADNLEPIGDGIDKFSLPILTPGVRRALPLDRIYVLRPGASKTISLTRLSGPEAVGAILDNIYRWPLAVAMGVSAAEFAQALALAERCEIVEIGVTHDATAPWKLFEAIERGKLT